MNIFIWPLPSLFPPAEHPNRFFCKKAAGLLRVGIGIQMNSAIMDPLFCPSRIIENKNSNMFFIVILSAFIVQHYVLTLFLPCYLLLKLVVPSVIFVLNTKQTTFTVTRNIRRLMLCDNNKEKKERKLTVYISKWHMSHLWASPLYRPDRLPTYQYVAASGERSTVKSERWCKLWKWMFPVCLSILSHSLTFQSICLIITCLSVCLWMCPAPQVMFVIAGLLKKSVGSSNSIFHVQGGAVVRSYFAEPLLIIKNKLFSLLWLWS